MSLPFPASSSPVDRARPPAGLTERWYPLRPHPEQHRFWTSSARFKVCPAGRRSGKTEIEKRRLVGTALCAHAEANFFAAAPTWGQAKRIWWNDLKALSPPELVVETRESREETYVRYVNGASIWVVGTDKPARIEGMPWDGGVLDEFANMKPTVWEAHLRPMMAERGGWCDFIGVPEGHNHYFELFNAARLGQLGPEWDTFTWVSADILPAAEIEAARRDMPEDLYLQEFEAAFTAFRGRAYKEFRSGPDPRRWTPGTNTAPLKYDPTRPLVFMLDFNVEPGAAVVAQEMTLPNGQRGTGIIGEVYIPYDSDTPAVCRRLVADWKGHRGTVVVYGDATGGSRRTSAEAGATDWKLVRRELRGHFRQVVYRVPDANPDQRDRVNNVNARILNAAGEIRLMVDPVAAPRTVTDFEGVRLLEGGAGEIAKTGERNKGLTHWTDGVGYYVSERFPIPDYSASGATRRRFAPS